MTGVLIAGRTSGLFSQAVQDLQKIAQLPAHNAPQSENRNLPQVHALNCLKEACTDTRLGSATEEHMTDMVQLAVDSLESNMYVFAVFVNDERC